MAYPDVLPPKIPTYVCQEPDSGGKYLVEHASVIPKAQEISMNHRLSALFVACVLTANWASAAIIYDESVSGDLGTFDPIVLNLAAGENSVLGSSAFSLSSNADFFDGFNVQLAAGQTLHSIDYYISNRSMASNTSVMSTTYAMRSGGHAGAVLALATIDVFAASPQAMFASELPVSGVLSFATSPVGGGWSGDGGAWDYEIRFTVSDASAVPEPATLTIWGLGVIGCAVAAYRRKKQTA